MLPDLIKKPDTSVCFFNLTDSNQKILIPGSKLGDIVIIAYDIIPKHTFAQTLLCINDAGNTITVPTLNHIYTGFTVTAAAD